MDLHKLANIVITDSGSACILDFQLSLPIFGRSRWTCTPIIMLFEHLKREDFYHVYKHKRRFQQEMMSEKELRFAQRSLANERFFRYVGEPYRKIKRLIYPKGSNETIWYRWKERRDRSHEVP